MVDGEPKPKDVGPVKRTTDELFSSVFGGMGKAGEGPVKPEQDPSTQGTQVEKVIKLEPQPRGFGGFLNRLRHPFGG